MGILDFRVECLWELGVRAVFFVLRLRVSRLQGLEVLRLYGFRVPGL